MADEAAAGGSILGPIGALAGAGLGAGTSLYDTHEQKKAAKAKEPKRKKLAQTADTMQLAQDRKMAAMASLSEAAMQWANLAR